VHEPARAGYSAPMVGTREHDKLSLCECCDRWHRDLYPFDGHALCLPCYRFVRGLMDPYYGQKHAVR